MTIHKTCGWVVFYLLAGLPLIATGTESSVIVTSKADTNSETQELVWLMRTLLNEDPRFSPVDLPALLDADVDPEAGSQALAAARTALDDLEIDKARKSLEKATLFLGASHNGKDPRHAEALRLLAQTLLSSGRSNEARAVYTQLLNLGLAATASGSLRPSARRVLAQAEGDVRASRTGTLRVGGKTRGRAVFLNGRYRGQTPLELKLVSVGRHHVRISSDGYLDGLHHVTVKHRRTTRVSPRLKRASRFGLFTGILKRLPSASDRERGHSNLADLRAVSFADHAIILEPQTGNVVATLYDLKWKRKVRTVDVQLGPPQTVAEDIVRQIYQGLDPTQPSLLRADVEVTQTSIMGRWWFWAGGVALATAIVVPLVIMNGDEPVGIERTPGTGAVLVDF